MLHAAKQVNTIGGGKDSVQRDAQELVSISYDSTPKKESAAMLLASIRREKGIKKTMARWMSLYKSNS